VEIIEDHDDEPTRTQTVTANNKIAFALVASLLILIGVTIWGRIDLPSATLEISQDQTATAIPADKSIAVLPFADMSPEGNQEYFGDGISEELLNELARLEGLRVASRTSSFSFKDTDATASDIGESLNVGLILV